MGIPNGCGGDKSPVEAACLLSHYRSYGPHHCPDHFYLGPEPRLDYACLRRLCRERGLLFEDPEFPPCPRLGGKAKAPQITWLRPFEISQRPKFISDGTSKFDIEQGQLGDCWLLSAISCLTLTPRFLERVVPSEQHFGAGYCGIFRFRFWRFGEWVEVVIDDRLPTYKGHLVYMHSSDPHEFWPALLEKAYAKFYGGYENLCGGHTGQALQDLTGGIAQNFELSDHDPLLVYTMVSSAVPRSTLLAASILSQPHSSNVRLRSGLISNQAYSITGLARVRASGGGEVPLIRLRNPWGKGEWTGPWCERSWEWERLSDRDRDQLGHRVRNEGEFWMSFEDFVRHFTHLDLLHIGPDDWLTEGALHTKRPWRAVLARRRWRSGFNAGGGPQYKETTATNPQFRLHIPKQGGGIKKCHVVVSVIQQYCPTRLQDSKKSGNLLPIGFAVYEIPSTMSRLTAQYVATHRPLDLTVHSQARETVTFFTLPPGDFVIMPCTAQPNCDTKFLLRILTDEQSTIWEVNEDNVIYRELSFIPAGDLVFSQNGHGPLTKLLTKLPNEVSAQVLLKILRGCWKSLQLLSEKPSLELCRNFVMIRDPLITGKIVKTDIPSLIYSLQFWRSVFLKFDPSNKGRTSSYTLRSLLWDAGITVSNKVLECLVVRYAKSTTITAESFLLTLVKLHLAHERFAAVERKTDDNPLTLEEMILMTIYS